MTSDTGFAPNPFHGTITLANCKPYIRMKKNKGDFIAGFTSNKLCGEKVGEERLIYIMKVTEKLSYEEYFHDERFQCKIPSDQSLIAKAGDNIYKPSATADLGYVQLPTRHHQDVDEMKRDLKGKYVLLSTEFYYFGKGAIPIDNFRIKIPKFQSAYGVKTDNTDEITKLWNYLNANYKKNVALNPPHKWKESEPFN